MESLTEEEYEALKEHQRKQLTEEFIEGRVFELIEDIDNSKSPQKGIVVNDSFLSQASGKTYQIKLMHLEDGHTVQLSYLNFDNFKSTPEYKDVLEWEEHHPLKKKRKRRM